MKSYSTQNTLCLVGKGWQIRAYCKQFKSSKATLQKFLSAQHRQTTKTKDYT